MKSSDKHLVLFTAEFPYGYKSEPFLETEILYLSKHFESITIVPSNRKDEVRQLPKNITVNNCLTYKANKNSKAKGLILNCLTVIKILSNEAKDKGLKRVAKNYKVYLDHLSQEIIKVNRLLKEPDLINSQYIYYDYWFQNSVVALSILKYRNKITRFVSRGHGYDIYDSRNKSTGVRFRSWVVSKISRVYVVSNYGYKYFLSKIKTKYHYKIHTAMLGVEEPKKRPHYVEKGSKLIVSCARVEKFKGIEKIPLLLKKLNGKIHWVHFGSGSQIDKVKSEAENLPKNITYEFRGQVKNHEIHTFYSENNVDLLISLSKSEGLPVSMMEAISYGVPVLSTAVGGVPEIVIDGKTGFLFNENKDLDQMAKKLDNTLNYIFDHNFIIDYFNTNFNAKINYHKFIQEIHSVKR